MVLKCCVDNCWNTKRPNLAFHRFPLGDAERLRQWLFALNMDANTPPHVVDKLFVCQKHFQADDYCAADQQNRRGRFLRTNAVPSQFGHTRPSEAGDAYLDVVVSGRGED